MTTTSRRSSPFLRISTFTALVSLSVACQGSDGHQNLGSGGSGEGGRMDGGTGGKSVGTGGQGGTKTGGTKTGGMQGATGGMGGTTAGGTGGTIVTGGAGGTTAGGSGGTTPGGSGGTIAGGTGGTVTTPAALSGEGIFFSGRDQSIAKLFAADAQPGYFYGTQNFGMAQDSSPLVPSIVSVSDPLLPAGTKYAVFLDAPAGLTTPYNTIFGFNFRANKDGGQAWQFLDASKYAGYSLYIRTALPAESLRASLVDATNIPSAAENKGTCPGATKAECPTPNGTAVIARKAWSKIALRFADLTGTGTGVVKTELARLDLIRSHFSMETTQLWITAIKLETDAELTAQGF